MADSPLRISSLNATDGSFAFCEPARRRARKEPIPIERAPVEESPNGVVASVSISLIAPMLA